MGGVHLDDADVMAVLGPARALVFELWGSLEECDLPFKLLCQLCAIPKRPGGVLGDSLGPSYGSSCCLDERAEGLQPVGEDFSVVSVLFTAAETSPLFVKALALNRLIH